MAKDKDTNIQLTEENKELAELKPEKEKTEKASTPVASVEKKIPTKKVTPKTGTVMGTLRSANSFPSEFVYKKEKAFIPPNGRIPNVKKDLLEFPLPSGVKFVPND